jgi:C_GCAxxG_C_C family probable redox protein
MAVKVREPYQGLSREELLNKVYDLGANYEIHSYSCSQCTVAALHEILGFPDALVKAATMACGGTAFQLTGTCGGLTGGIMVLDYYFGRPVEHMSYTETIQSPNIADLFVAQPIARSLFNKYMERYGTITCANIQQQLFGRLYYFEDMDEFGKFEKAGAHTDPTKAPDIVGTAARWTLEILLDKGAVEVGK